MTASQLTGWIPIRVYWKERRPLVDWCWVGSRRFSEPFFDHTIDVSMRLPFSAFFRPQTPIEMLRERHAGEPGLKPRGFIFHMSRCGSTLVSQMLAAIPDSIVISEAGCIDSVLRAKFIEPALSDEQRADWLRWIVSALGQRRRGDENNLFIKFDSWSVLDFPLISRTFPDVPWMFLYRNPVEVLVSQLAHRGAHMVPGAIEPALFGMDPDEVFQMLPEEYCARILARVCEAALQYHRVSGGMLVNYANLPDAVWTRVLDFFDTAVSGADRESFRQVVKRDAKNPRCGFDGDSQAKQDNASEPVRMAAKKWLAPLYEQLEAASRGEPAS